MAKWLLLAIALCYFQLNGFSQQFEFSSEQPLSIVYDPQGPKLDSIAASLLASDIESLINKKPILHTSLRSVSGQVILVGNYRSPLLQSFIPAHSTLYKRLSGKWESYALKIFDHPVANISKLMLIAGSDPRGTAYGVFSISEKIGVSPWYWWADVPVKKHSILKVNVPEFVSSPPSVKYRGIFINDEDWGLQPWAAKTFEKETGDIGPKTYAKVFELLLRLKANLLWPAMHPSTKAFYHYPQNKEVAADYSIIIGSSHAEPMLRNNVGEWNKNQYGDFNYLTNKDKVIEYWQSRIKETSRQEVIYTMGMRGVHDSHMEGVKDEKQAVPVLEKIIQDQRTLLQRYRGKTISSIPLVFTAYKEVLDIYDNGLKLPEDITIVWPDDNYGYIQRLNSSAEKSRSGGSGVYYHASYWGRPHDYLWLSSTHPGLIREEMLKAWQNGSDQLWILNVGDIKPLEYNIQLFMDMAYQIQDFNTPASVHKHLEVWSRGIFGYAKYTNGISDVLWKYYQLAFERRPEFMGWSQTEPTTKTNYTAYNHFHYGDEAEKRIKEFESLENKVKQIGKMIPASNQDAFYQLIYYPVMCASWMNKKFLYRDKAFLYAKQNRLIARHYATASHAMYDNIVNETKVYNQQLSLGKWKEIMSMKPRELPVFQPPDIKPLAIQKGSGWGLALEGEDSISYSISGEKKLPGFQIGAKQRYFIDVFLTDSITLQWSMHTNAEWIRLSAREGTLRPDEMNSMQRIWVTADVSKLYGHKNIHDQITVSVAGKETSFKINITALLETGKHERGFTEINGVVCIYSNHFKQNSAGKNSKWVIVPGLGYTDTVVRAELSKAALKTKPDTNLISQNAAYLDFEFFTHSEGKALLSIFTIPTHPLNRQFSMRYAISVDNSPIRILDTRTFGRSEEWKQNVLRNQAICEININSLQPGKHNIRIYAVDPGLMLDRLVLKFEKAAPNYGLLPETTRFE